MKNKQGPIFITGRFRSGTSFLWQIFNHLKGYCAWYEPLHPQLLTAITHTKPKTDHVGVKDYWGTYRNNPCFSIHYDVAFATDKLYLEAKDEYRKLEMYIKNLMYLSADEIPVLQFNRVDFRLPWLREKFPNATIIHIDRNPISLFHSQRKHIADESKNDASYWDAYELMPWCYALNNEFPFLLGGDQGQEHAFYPFYAIYKLSKMLAQLNADVFIDLDEDVFNSDHFLVKLKNELSLDEQQLAEIKGLKHVPKVVITPESFTVQAAQIMQDIDQQITSSGLSEFLGKRKLSAIQLNHQDFWDFPEKTQVLSKQLLPVVMQTEKEVSRINNENKEFQAQLNEANNSSEQCIKVMIDSNDDIEQLSLGELLIVLNQLNNDMTTVLGVNEQLRVHLKMINNDTIQTNEESSK